MISRRNFIMVGVVSVLYCRKGLSTVLPASRPSVLDDTGHLQSLLDRKGNVILESGRHYVVSCASGSKVALYMESDTHLDLNGATLQLAANQRGSLLGARKGRVLKNSSIFNGIIDGGGVFQPPQYDRGLGITPTIYFERCEGLRLRDLHMKNTYMYSAYIKGSQGLIDNIRVDGAIGGGIHVQGDQWRIDRLYVKDVTFFDQTNCLGNPFIVNLTNSRIGRVICENFGYGVKFQDGCENLVVDYIEATGGRNTTDFLVKIQGKKNKSVDRPNRNLTFGIIKSSNGPNSGLYIYHSRDVTISSYQGDSNGQGVHFLDWKNSADVLVIDSDRIHFAELMSFRAPRYAVWLHESAGDVTADQIIVEPNSLAVANPIVVHGGRAILGGKTYVR